MPERPLLDLAARGRFREGARLLVPPDRPASVLASVAVDPVEQRGGDGIGGLSVAREDVLDGRGEIRPRDAKRASAGGGSEGGEPRRDQEGPADGASIPQERTDGRLSSLTQTLNDAPGSACFSPFRSK